MRGNVVRTIHAMGNKARLIVCLLTAFVTAGANTASALQATFAWDAPTSNEDGSPLVDLSGYKLYMGTVPATYDSVIDVGNNLTRTVDALDEGQTYYLSVTAYNIDNLESDFAAELLWQAPDVTPPVIEAPATLALEADDVGLAAVPAASDLLISLADNVSSPGAITIEQTPAAGSTVAVGQHELVITATDEAGNASDHTLSITVSDVTAPSVTGPAGTTITANGAGKALAPDILALVAVSDNASAPSAITLTQSPAAGTQLTVGEHTVSVTATDEAGNSTTWTTIVIVIPKPKPNSPKGLRVVGWQ